MRTINISEETYKNLQDIAYYMDFETEQEALDAAIFQYRERHSRRIASQKRLLERTPVAVFLDQLDAGLWTLELAGNTSNVYAKQKDGVKRLNIGTFNVFPDGEIEVRASSTDLFLHESRDWQPLLSRILAWLKSIEIPVDHFSRVEAREKLRKRISFVDPLWRSTKTKIPEFSINGYCWSSWEVDTKPVPLCSEEHAARNSAHQAANKKWHELADTRPSWRSRCPKYKPGGFNPELHQKVTEARKGMNG